MAANDKKKTEETKVNWNYMIAGVAALGGLALVLAIVKQVTAEDEAKRKEAERILADWEREWNTVEPFMQSIYAGSVVPTAEQTTLLGQQLDMMKHKELAIQDLSKSTWAELGDMARNIGIGLGVAIGVPIAGYVAVKLVNNWIDKHRPPPNFPCPVCDQVFATKGQLKYHLETQHYPRVDALPQAQQMFLNSPLFIQNYVASQSGYYNSVALDWRYVGVAVLVAIAVAIAIIATAGIATPAVVQPAVAAMALAFA